MQVFVRDASTVAVEVEPSTTVAQLKERWCLKAYGFAASTWVSLRVSPRPARRPCAPMGRPVEEEGPG